jgi:hypothetical protein
MQNYLSQVHDHVMFSFLTIRLDFFHQCHPPLKKLFWGACVIFVNLHNVGLGILVRGVNWDLERTKLCVTFLVILVGLHTKFRLQFIIKKRNWRRKHDILLLPCGLQNTSIILIIILYLAMNRHISSSFEKEWE